MTTSLKEAQKDTILGMVNEIFEKGELINGEFICPIEDPVGENGTVIGKATDYEKAIVLVARPILERQKKHMRETKEEDWDMDQLFEDRQNHKALMSIFWSSVRKRLGRPVSAPEFLGIREDWQLVAYFATVAKSKANHVIEIHCIGEFPFPGFPFFGFPKPPTAGK